MVYSYLPLCIVPFPNPALDSSFLTHIHGFPPIPFHISGPLSSSPANLLLYPPCGWSAPNNDSWSNVEILSSVKKSLPQTTKDPEYCQSLFRNRKVFVTQLWLTHCDLMDCSPPGSSVYGIFQARVLEWVAISFSRGSSRPRDRTCISCIPGRFFTVWATRVKW